MTRLRVFWSRVIDVVLRRRRDARLAAEVEAHLAELTDEFTARGLPRDEARLAARRAFGGVDQMTLRHRDQRGLPWLDALAQDLRFAARLLRRDPRFGLVTIGSLAVSIAAITFVFSAVNALVLRPLPIADPGSVHAVQSGAFSFSYPDYRDLRDRNGTLSALVGYRIAPASLARGGEAVFAWGYLATGNYFEALGVRPALGRLLTAADDAAPGASAVVVLSHDCWRTRFAADPGVVGATVTLNGAPFTVIGVAPEGFYGIEISYRPDFWVPMMMQSQIEPGNSWLERRTTQNTMVAARTREGVSRLAAEANLNAIAAALNREHTRRTPLTVRLTAPGMFGDMLGGPARAVAWGVMALGGLLLLAGCFNLAGVLLARGADRGAEIALRSAIGAGRGRIVRQLVTEAVLLALLGGSLGALIAWWAAAAASGRRLPVELPVAFDLHADGRVFAFAFVLSAIVGVLVAIAPARFAARLDVTSLLRQGEGPRRAGRRWTARDVFACVQVALCVVLLHTCLLALGGLRQATTTSLGWNPAGIAVAGVDLGLAGYDHARARQFQDRLLEDIRRIPGVTAAATANGLPLSIDQSNNVVFADRDDQFASGTSAATYQVSPGFFHTLEIAFVAGREFTDFDRQPSPAVAIVNRALAEQLFGTSSAVGRRVRFGRGGGLTEVVGIVEDGKYYALSETRRPAVFLPQAQWFNYSTLAIVRSRRPEAAVAEELRGVILRMDPALPLRMAATGAQVVALSVFPYRVAAAALGALSVIAAGLMLTGVHALMAYLVVRRRRDIAVRVALGGSRRDVLRSVLSHIAGVLGIGAAAGFVVAMATGAALSTLALGASPRDPAMLVLLVAGVLAIAVASCWGPVRRSLRLDPVAVLREG